MTAAEPPAAAVEAAARALDAHFNRWSWASNEAIARDMLSAALASGAVVAAENRCEDRAPSLPRTLPVFCEREEGHGGWHEGERINGLPPMRWIKEAPDAEMVDRYLQRLEETTTDDPVLLQRIKDRRAALDTASERQETTR